MLKQLNVSVTALLRSLAVAMASVIMITGHARASAPIPINGQEPVLDNVQPKLPASTPAVSLLQCGSDFSVVGNASLLRPDVTLPVRTAAMSSGRAMEVKEVTGSWIMTYKTLLQGGKDGGRGVTVVASATENEYVIKDFWAEGLEVKAEIDLATGRLSIPNQVITTTDAGLQVDITAIDHSTGAPLRDTPVTGQFNADGTVTIDTWWALYYADKTEMNDGMVVAYYPTRMIRPNGQFTFTQNNEDFTVPVYADQIADNVLEVTNLVDGGLTIEMVLNRDLTASIALQPIMNSTTVTYNICNAVIDGESVSFTSPVTTEAATDRKVISWTNWSGYGLTSEGRPTWLGMFTSARIVLDNEIVYPSISTTSLKGAGTKDNPWLIETKDDLIYMSDMVNGMDASNSLCSGEYFMLVNDIDMSRYRFTTIAKDYYHIFDGIFDGNNHTIDGLTIDGSGYAALIGRAGDNSVIRNLTVSNADIKASSFSGAVVAWSTGEISGVRVKSSTIVNTSTGTGAIGNIVNNITDCHAENCDITGQQGFTGGLVGQVNGTMSGCSATGMRLVSGSPSTGANPVGGLVGLANYQSVITDSYFTGTINASYGYTACDAGGIVGSVRGATINRCFSAGTVHGYSSDAYTGGLVGLAMSATITDCYANGRVNNGSSRMTGGLTGYVTNGTLNEEVIPCVFRNCYSSSALSASTLLYNPETECREVFGTIADGTVYTAENIYFNNQLVNFGSTKYGVAAADLVSASGPAGFPADNWVFTQGQYPRIKGMESSEAALYSASALIIAPNSSLSKMSQDATFNALGSTDMGYIVNGMLVKQGHYSTIEGNTLRLNSDYAFGTDTLYVVNGRSQYHYYVRVAPVPYEGAGTETSPYLIRTKDDLILLSKITTEAKQSFPGTYFLMTNDIDLEYSEDFLGIMGDGGTSTFAGTFDGGGHAVHRMRINEVNWTKQPTDATLGTVATTGVTSYKGFIGRLDAKGTVRNLTIAADCQLVFAGYSGAVVGYNAGRIENCRNMADVTTYSGIYVGGIAGYNDNTETAVVIDCYNGGNITTARYGIGGITGANYSLVKNCVNTGNVEAKVLVTNYDRTKNYLVGGITGTMSGRLENCVNYGTVSGNDRIGGLSGTVAKQTGNFVYLNDVVNCINLGMVYSDNTVACGAIGGVSGSDGVITGNYWDVQLLPLAAVANTGAAGMTGVNTQILTSGTVLEGYDAEVWDFTAGLYPTIRKFATDDDVARARAIIVDMPDGVNAYDLTGSKASLAVRDGLTWRLAGGVEFAIEGNELVAPESVKTLVVDTLYADYGTVVKPILVKALPSMPLTGSGTVEDPYLITSAEDWNALAEFMTQTANSLDGKVVALANDIDFTGKTFVPLASDGSTYLNGTLDGKGFAVNGIKYTATATYAGAIGAVGTIGVVRNLTMRGAVTSAFASTGGFTGKLYGSLENCVNEVSVTSTKATAGGFAATVYGTASAVDCVNRGNVSAVSNAGGFAGTFDSASKVTLIRCGNEATVKGNSNSAYVGGLVGTAYPATLTDCYNKGEITVTTPTTQSFAAGLVGYASGTNGADPYEISGCVNSGNVTAKSGAAGIVSNVHSTAGYTVLHITGCSNSGDITSKGTANTSNTANAGIAAMLTPGSVIADCHNSGNISVGINTNTGGITGYSRVAGTKALPIKISGCDNSGVITAAGSNVGGIIANASAYTYIEDCHNTGAVNTSEKAYATGGIAGALTNVNAGVTRCWNIGDVTTATNRAGGIVGMNAAKAALTDCWNGGDITTTSEVQGVTATSGYGIGGVAGQSASVLTRCYNYGTVTGVSRVGGVIGAPTKGNTTLLNCYNAGRIVAPADTCGNLIGVNLKDNGTIWNSDNAVTDSYYVTDYGVYDNNSGFGIATSVKNLTATNLGEAWSDSGDYCYPVSSVFASDDAALLYSTAVVLTMDDTYDCVAHGFNVGTAGGTQWSATPSVLSFDGNNASFTSTSTGEVELTASLGELSRKVVINTNVTTSGINDIITDNDDAEAVYYTLQGLRVMNPVKGHLYIVCRGNVTTKELYR